MSRFQPRVWFALEKTMNLVQSIHFSEYGEVVSFKQAFHGEELLYDPEKHLFMQCSGMKCSLTQRLIYESDIVLVDYQYGDSVCEVRWCPIKYTLILHPISGVKPKHKPHFRLAGKRGVFLLGNKYEGFAEPSKQERQTMKDALK